MNFLLDNLSTFIVSLILIYIVYRIVKNMINNHKNGQSTCSGSCSKCSNGGCSHATSLVKDFYEHKI